MRRPNVAIYMLRCAELGLSVEMLERVTMGDVYDMVTEKANDAEEYPLAANQEDIDLFFP